VKLELEQALAALQKNEPSALERALGLLQDTVFSFSMRVCGHREDAEDTMQETLLQAAKQLPSFDSPKALAVWLYKVAKSRCLMSRRKSRFAPKEHLSLEVLMPDRAELERLSQSGGETPERLLLAGESSATVQSAVLKLPPEYRLILVLHDMEGLSTDEIARVMSLREGTVRVRLHRARVFVRNELTAQTAGGEKRARRAKAAKAKPAGCKDLFAKLSDYLDGQLDPGRCDDIEKHMDGCDPCKAFLESLEKTVSLLQKHEPGKLDAETAASFRSALLLEYQQALRDLARTKSGAAPAR
jgi:RNA polymerase sigma-70 factor (ECF subfamily)